MYMLVIRNILYHFESIIYGRENEEQKAEWTSPTNFCFFGELKAYNRKTFGLRMRTSIPHPPSSVHTYIPPPDHHQSLVTRIDTNSNKNHHKVSSSTLRDLVWFSYFRTLVVCWVVKSKLRRTYVWVRCLYVNCGERLARPISPLLDSSRPFCLLR